MEKWKIAAISALLIALLGFGIWQQNADKQRTMNPNPVPSGTPQSSVYIGKTLPPWNFKTWNSKPVPLASLQGNPALIEIFRIDCSHCNDAAPMMVAIQKRYGPRGLKIVSIQSPGAFNNPANPENSWPAVQAWIKAKGINFPVAFDPGSKYFQGTIQKQILGDDATLLLYPTLLFTDKTGVIDFAQTGHDLSKAITLGVELEKRFPGSLDIQKNAADLVAWLQKNVAELEVDTSMAKALRDDIAQRLQKKK